MSDDNGPWGRLPPRPAPRRPRSRLWISVMLVAGAGVFGLMWLFPGRISTPTDWGYLGRGLGVLALVAAGAGSLGRLGAKTAVRYAAIWIALAGVLVLGVTYKDELGSVAARVRSALVPSYAVSTGDHRK